jgi:hypothetical protein
METILYLVHINGSTVRNNLPSLLDDLNAIPIHVATDCYQEFVDRKSLVVVEVKCIKEGWKVLVTNANFEIATSFLEFVKVEAIRTIVIHIFENTL